jgi:hypothetical protein
MYSSARARFLGVLVGVMMFIPILPVGPVGAGSNLTQGGTGFQNGTSNRVSVTEEGLELAVETEMPYNWTRLNMGEPGPKNYPYMEYDLKRQVSVLVGWEVQNECPVEVWTYNSTTDTWKNMRPLEGWDYHQCPGISSYGSTRENSMAYDPIKDVLVLFGLSGFWTYDLGKNKWTMKNPSPSPPLREGHSLVYDSVNKEIVLFGGNECMNPTMLYNDTWSYNVATDTWTNRTPAISPPARANHSMAFDSANGEMVLFGGYSDTLLNDTWTYNLSTNLWTQKNPKNAPSPRHFHDMVYHESKGVIILYGGFDEEEIKDTWSYNLTADAWIELKPASSPPFSAPLQMVYEPSTGEVITCLGWTGRPKDEPPGYYWCGVTDELLWKYNLTNNTWTLRPPKAPSQRVDSSMVYDSRTGEFLIYDGSVIPPVYDTWLFNLSTNSWRKIITDYTPECTGAQMVYDSVNDIILLLSDKIIELNLTTKIWTPMEPSFEPIHYYSTMTYDSKRGEIFLLNGVINNETWTYNYSNNTWTQLFPQNTPSPRWPGTMVYLDATDEFLLYGGHDFSGNGLNETWKFNRTNNIWYNVTGSKSPDVYDSFEMVYDNSRNEVILVKGYVYYLQLYNETWRFNLTSNSWDKIRTKDYCPTVARYSLGYDQRLKEIIRFGGAEYPGGSCYAHASGEVWVFHGHSHYQTGNYTSEPQYVGGPAKFGELDWESDTPDGTTLRLQLRTGDTNASMLAGDFLGPDGTNKTFYNASGKQIADVHNGSRWIQYKVFFNSTYPAITPTLKSVTINYNRIHDISITSPSGGENWTGVQNITWVASDPDNDSLSFDIYLLNGSERGTILLAQNLSNETRSWEWNTNDTPSGDYRIWIVARDDNTAVPVSVNATSIAITIYHPIPNRAPKATLLGPDDNAIINTTEVTLRWSGSDDEGDPLQYFLFFQKEQFGPGDLPTPLSFTCATSYEATGLSNGTTYYWAVLAFDGKVNGSLSDVRSFTVEIPSPPNNPPQASLLSPENGAVFNTTSVTLSWKGSDPDGDNITYHLFLAGFIFDNASLPSPLTTTNMTSYEATGRVNGTTYHWAVMPNDGNLDGPLTGIRSFSIDISKGNHLPVIGAVTAPDAYVDEAYYLDITASDADNDTLTFNLTEPPTGMTINADSGRIQWTPNKTGNFNVTVNVTDIKGGYTTLTFSVKVIERPLPVKPTVSISLANNSKVSKKALFSGTTTAGSLSVARIEIFLDSKSKGDASGTTSWSYEVDTTKLSNGRHTFTARAYDSSGNYNETSTDFIVNNPAAAAKSEFPWWILALVLVIVAVGVGASAYSRTKKAPSPLAQEDEIIEEPPAPAEKEALPTESREGIEPPMAAVLSEAPAIQSKAKKDTVVPTEAAKETAVPAKIAKASVPRPPPVASAPVPAITATEGFAVEDIFLMYRDGRLIQHTTRRLKPDMDFDIMTSMLKAVQDFVKESIGMAEGAELGSMEYGENKILLEKGKYIILAAVIAGAEPDGFRDEMKGAVKNIESEFTSVLPGWDGGASRLAGARKFLARLGAFTPAVAGQVQKVSEDVGLKSELEFYQGFIRLKVAVKNHMKSVVTNAELKLLYDREAMRLDHIEPDLKMEGADIQLGIIGPNEKKTVAFYLDPQICTESYIDGNLTFKDAEGGLRSLTMARKMASVVCPILFTEENINTAMLKRMAAEELDKKDAKVYNIPPSLSPDRAFEIAKAAVQHHDLRLVRELTQKEPYAAEAWYFGKVKGREDRLIVRARIIAERNVLEFFVASSSTLMLTGMLAELKTDLNKELEGKRFEGRIVQVTDARSVEALGGVMSLLDKYMKNEARPEGGMTGNE